MRHLQREESLFLVHFFSLLADSDEAKRMLGEIEGRDDARASEWRWLIESVVDVLDPAWESVQKKHVLETLAHGSTLRDALASLDQEIEKDVERQEVQKIGLLVVRSQVRQNLGDLAGAEKDLSLAGTLMVTPGQLELSVKLEIARCG